MAKFGLKVEPYPNPYHIARITKLMDDNQNPKTFTIDELTKR